ncbi:hypothetical protein KSC_020240 [Ktedonobacter sp. SOSP1-52]|uniref:hypothetical protein n=1 Tax=Ktedonobacter sp. SOSP1-52 TaxID=2778366 RepID=UPI0019165951|nr:hypothetical protein [Ktedonobacter sp. SOSP1-52]GHO63132.1 hypothetical protein KSC_020240 [Ktedonobacter sp. SOSP1-52]
MVQAQSSVSAPQKIYKQNSILLVAHLFLLALGLGFGVLFLVLSLRMAIDLGSRIVGLFGAAIMAVLGVLVFLGFRRMRLITSPQGVILNGLGYKVYTPWDNIKELKTDWYGGNNAYSPRLYQPAKLVEGFIFYRPAVFGLSVEDGLRQHVPVIQGWTLLAVQMSRFSHMLPLAGFLNEQTRQELIEDAKKYAPQTFQVTQKTS